MYEIFNGGTNNTSTDFYKENGTVAPFFLVNPTKLIQKTKVYKILKNPLYIYIILVQKLQNDKHAHSFIKGFPMIPKVKQGAPQFGKV
jgi:hypothetical protein